MSKAIDSLQLAVGRDKKDIEKNNLFKKIGFDGENGRLGWALLPTWQQVSDALKAAKPYLKGKTEFIFIGMGGSANGVKTVGLFKKQNNIHVVDSLDPKALDEVISKIKNVKKTLVIPISKSGTTKETQSLANSLKRIFKTGLKKHYLWLVDSNSSAKLDKLGWKSFPRLPIQVNDKTDIGGRFSSPHTLIFFLPLYILLGQKIDKLKKVYDDYFKVAGKVVKKADKDAAKDKSKNKAYYSVLVDKKVYTAFNTWIVQLFQESLGSKIKNYPVKTVVVTKKGKINPFTPLSAGVNVNIMVDVMATMLYLQYFVSFTAFYRKINFVNQPSVEKYKNAMRQLAGKKIPEIANINHDQLEKILKKKLKANHKFLEVVLFFHASQAQVEKVEKWFKKKFPKKTTFVFIGSDWNHHSYQAAAADKETLFVLITKQQYQKKVSGLCSRRMKENIETLKLIAYATYSTIKSKAVLAAVEG